MEAKITPNARTYKLLMSGCNSAGQWQKALRILRTCGNVSQTFDLKREALRALDRGQQWTEALRLWTELSSNWSDQDPELSSLGASTLERAGRWQDALEILQRIKSTPDVVTLNTAASCYAQKEEWSETRKALKEMKQRQMTPDLRALRAGIEASAASMDWQESLRLLEQVEDDAASTDASSTVMATLSSCQQWAQAMELFQRQRQKGRKLDVTTLRNLIQLVGSKGQWKLVHEIYEEIEQRKVLGEWWNSSVLEDKQKERRKELNDGICNAGRWQDALELWQQMKAEKLEPPEGRSFPPLLKASCQSSWQNALMMLQEAQKERHVPSVDSYGALVECCARQQQWQEALQLLQAHNATAKSYATVINAARDQPQVVAELFQKMPSRPSWAVSAASRESRVPVIGDTKVQPETPLKPLDLGIGEPTGLDDLPLLLPLDVERIVGNLVAGRLAMRKQRGLRSVPHFEQHPHSLRHIALSPMPSILDCYLGYVLGHVAGALIEQEKSGYVANVRNVGEDVLEYHT
eukprot:symbB.v1.2.002875.t1/scaffold155.1/size293413/10